MRFSMLIAAMLSTAAILVMSAPIDQVYERDYEDVMAREPLYRGVGPVRPFNLKHMPMIGREPAASHQKEPVASSIPASIMSMIHRSLPEDELEARGWFSVIKDGAQGVEALKSAHDSKKKNKKGKRDLEDLEELYEREFYDWDFE
ncbi:hypothetical protein EVJ58_g4223 [Rhodofomes roseus]|uniref:Uncharacterized protein n=1 Tax=Rhodofomes roseus TaxID=34475 RepID=A0A4Y9YJ78_9APHY|nr:hypothetical protein EVJ58_g4223 [Rhodofomes roseus]